jgi:hypothetical protein
MIFQSSMDLGKSRCDVPSGTTQGQDFPIQVFIEAIPQFRFHEKKSEKCLLIFH